MKERKLLKRQYVVIRQSDETFCEGVYDDYLTAFGYVMDRIYQNKLYDYKEDKENYIFEILDPIYSDSSTTIEYRWKYPSFTNECSAYYYILDNDIYEENIENDKD